MQKCMHSPVCSITRMNACIQYLSECAYVWWKRVGGGGEWQHVMSTDCRESSSFFTWLSWKWLHAAGFSCYSIEQLSNNHQSKIWWLWVFNLIPIHFSNTHTINVGWPKYEHLLSGLNECVGKHTDAMPKNDVPYYKKILSHIYETQTFLVITIFCSSST